MTPTVLIVICNVCQLLLKFICSGLEAHVSNFFIFLVTIVLTSVSASAVAFMYSALVDVFALGNIMTAFTYVIMMVCMLMCVCAA